jgi:hypothetical protein
MVDIRDRFLETARKADNDFPDGNRLKLTHFSYIGKIWCENGLLHVVYMRAVITGMPMPRGQQALIFFDEQEKWVGRQMCGTVPLWCDKNLVFMFGLDEVEGQEGNAWDLGGGFAARKLVLQREYGSYLPPMSEEDSTP